jgi:microcystin-dependent protein
MSTPFLGEVRVFSFNFAPKGWALCNGQLLPINQNQALFALLGTMYGGNGTSNFQLPNLQGNTVLHAGNGFVQGQTGGEVNHTLLTNELPAHSHTVSVGGFATARDPKSHTFGVQGLSTVLEDIFSPTSSATAAPQLLEPVGGSQPHNNLQPYLVLTFCIALQGIFPSRN